MQPSGIFRATRRYSEKLVYSPLIFSVSMYVLDHTHFKPLQERASCNSCTSTIIWAWLQQSLLLVLCSVTASNWQHRNCEKQLLAGYPSAYQKSIICKMKIQQKTNVTTARWGVWGRSPSRMWTKIAIDMDTTLSKNAHRVVSRLVLLKPPGKKTKKLKEEKSSHPQQPSSTGILSTSIWYHLAAVRVGGQLFHIMPINTCVWRPLWLRFQEKRLRIHRAQDAKQSTKLKNHGPQFIFDSDCEGFFWKKGWQQRLSSKTAQFRLSLKTAQLICHQRLLDLECRQDYPT